MSKHLILVHGRAIKPSESVLRELAVKALAEGMRRIGKGSIALDIENGAIRFSSAYFGDISNDILAKSSAKERSKLTEKDPAHANAPCFPQQPLDEAFAETVKFPKFDKAQYQKVLAMASDMRLLDEAADTVSTLAALLSGGLFNTLLINLATKDLGAYLTSHDVGSAIRDRLNKILRPALLDSTQDVCLITHSMGCMVAYDVMWKYAHTSEYREFRETQKKVARWITIGCPLGEEGVIRNLLDGRYRDEEKYPSNQMDAWTNIHAQDDFISHVEKLAPIFKSNVKTGLPKIRDKKIYNCWVYGDVKNQGEVTSNPHDLYGYLMNEVTAQEVADWLVA